MPVQPIAPPLSGWRLSAQRWRTLTFLHWAIDPALVADRFPASTRPDVVDGVTYVGLVPFVMRGAGPGGRLSVPYFGDFCETNVRLYSVDEQDRHGIVFLTLDAARLATVLLARGSLGLPYAWSVMRADHTADQVRYTSSRRWPAPRRARCDVGLTIGPPATPTALETWLTSRWGLHTRVAGRTVWVPNEHPAWPLHEAELTHLEQDLVASCGIDLAGAPMLRPLFSPGVRTTFARPHLVANTGPHRTGPI